MTINIAINSGQRPTLILGHKFDKRVRAGSPWVYSNEIEWHLALKNLPPGELVTVYGKNGQCFGVAMFNPKSLISARLLTRDQNQNIDGAFFKSLFSRALALRNALFSVPYYRLIHAEADGCPGLIVDRYNDILVIEVNTAGMDRLQSVWIDPLIASTGARTVYFKNDSNSRVQEGLETKEFIYAGEISGPIKVIENDLAFFADLAGGQKTGWFYDQRANRRLVGKFSAAVQSALDLYSYLGGFALCAARGGAGRVTAVDRSGASMALAAKSAAENGLADKCEFVTAQVFDYLDQAIADKQTFDLVIADPPAFAKTARDIPAAKSGYRKLAAMCANVVAPDGFLFIASCSYHMDLASFTEQVAGGLAKSGRAAKILHTQFADADHPTHAHLAQSAYLKGLLLQLS